MQIKNQRLLYLIQHSNKQMFKIGIATNNSRFKQIDSDYSINWDNSLYFKGENEDIIFMEKILHRLFFKYRLQTQQGTGGTEWFSNECLEKVVDSIIFNVTQSEFNIDMNNCHMITMTNKITTSRPLLTDEQKEWLPVYSIFVNANGGRGVFTTQFNLSVDKRKELRKQLNILYDPNTDNTKDLYEKYKNPIFEEGYTTNGGNHIVTSDLIHREYLLYCTKENIIGLSDNHQYNNNTAFVLANLFKQSQSVCFEDCDFNTLRLEYDDIPPEYGIIYNKYNYSKGIRNHIYIFKKTIIKTISDEIDRQLEYNKK